MEAQFDLKVVLNDLSKDELIRIVDEIAREDSILKNRLLLQYSKTTTGQEIEQFEGLVNDIIHKNAGREMFVTYRQVSGFARELGDCIFEIEATEDAMTALELAFILLEKAIEAFQYADDSNGDIGSLVEETLEIIDVIVVEAVESEDNDRQALFKKLLQQCEHPIFEGWEEFRDTLLYTCIKFADCQDNREVLIRKIESLIDEAATEYTQRYHNETMTRLLFELIEEYGTEEEATEFIERNLHYSSFREQFIQRYMATEKFNQVLQLSTDGELADHKSPGLVSKWKNYRYAAYKGLSRHDEQQVLAKELFMAGDFEYYQELKELAKDPQQCYAQLKQELQQQSDWHAKRMYQSLIEEENDVVEMLAFVQKYPESIERYAKVLVGLYHEEIEAIYRAYIMKSAASASHRGAYQKVCELIRRYAKVVGGQYQQRVVDELRASYRRKSAFMDELGRVG